MTLALVRGFGNRFILLAWGLVPWPAPAQYTGRLIIEALNRTGKPIDEFQVILSANDTGQQRGAVGSKVVFDGLHAERYTVQVRSKGYISSKRSVTVVPGQTWLPVVLEPDIPICTGGPHRLRGRVFTGGTVAQMWIKLVNVFEDTVLHARPDSDGNFVLSGMPPGKYFLVVYSMDRIFQERIITIPRVDNGLLLISLDP